MFPTIRESAAVVAIILLLMLFLPSRYLRPIVVVALLVVLLMLLLVPVLVQFFQDPVRGSQVLRPYTVLGRAFCFSLSRGLHFASPCVARDFWWCDHDYRRWGEHT
jgi:cell division protein FtsW (lipid II flippase)